MIDINDYDSRERDIPQLHVADMTEQFEHMIKGMSEEEVQVQISLYNSCLECRRQELFEKLHKLDPIYFESMLRRPYIEWTYE